VRQLGCAKLGAASAIGATRADSESVPLDECIRAGAMVGPTPEDERACNAFDCDDEARVDGTTVLHLPTGTLGLSLGDSNAADALAADLRNDMSRSLFIAAGRVRIDTIRLESTMNDVEQARMNFSLLPISAMQFGSSQPEGGDTEAGAKLDTVVV